MSDFEFEWDEQKSQFNLKKHGVSFDEAADRVPHCESVNGQIRIISARKATIHERKQYEGYVNARKL